MKPLSALLLVLAFAGCSAEPLPDSGQPTEVAVSSPVPVAVSAADLEGSTDDYWIFCSGPSVLDLEAAFEAGEVRTYIEGRPSIAGSYTVEGGDLVLDDGDERYRVEIDASVLTLDTPADGVAVYARSTSGCPAEAD